MENFGVFRGKHEIEFQLANNEGVQFKKKFKFTLSEIDLSIAEQFDWREKFKIKGNISYNSDYDEFFGKDRPKNRPIDSQKLNASIKFNFGKIRVKTSALLNTYLIDKNALAALDRSQPVDRLKFGMNSPFLDFRYGDFTTELPISQWLPFGHVSGRAVFSRPWVPGTDLELRNGQAA